MNLKQLYQWREEIAKRLGMGRGLALGVAAYMMGMLEAESTKTSKVAERLSFLGTVRTVERRLERVLSNRNFRMLSYWPKWCEWVLKTYSSADVKLLVDETALRNHLAVMMVGLAYRGRQIPLVWRSYPRRKGGHEGQVQVIEKLLRRVRSGLTPGRCPLVLADAGIGTSPDLVKVIERLGWHYLFRVQRTVLYRPDHHTAPVPLVSLIQPGKVWSGVGQVFKEGGWLNAHVHLLWDIAYDDPWCLITNDPHLVARDYAYRNWQEQGFRDLKSSGFNWQSSRVWKPSHVNRLLLIVAMACAFLMTLGTLVQTDSPERQRRFTHPFRPKHSVFRIGLRYWRYLVAHFCPVPLALCFLHPNLFYKTVG